MNDDDIDPVLRRGEAKHVDQGTLYRMVAQLDRTGRRLLADFVDADGEDLASRDEAIALLGSIAAVTIVDETKRASTLASVIVYLDELYGR
jgi:hypothetical protein